MAERVVYGIQAVRQAIARAAGDVIEVFVLDDLGPARRRRLPELDRGGLVVRSVPAARLAALTGTPKHQGVAARVRASDPLDEAAARRLVEGLPAPLLLVLDGVQDPRNFGACLRTADAAGADLVVVGRSRTSAFTPVVSKVAAGAAETQPVAEVANLARFLAALGDVGVMRIGADDSAAVELYDLELAGPVALVLGAEGEGLRRLTRERCDRLARVPMHGTVESLNVAVAAGICLYEARRQRRLARPAALG